MLPSLCHPCSYSLKELCYNDNFFCQLQRPNYERHVLFSVTLSLSFSKTFWGFWQFFLSSFVLWSTHSACKWEWKQLLPLFLNIFITKPHLNFVQTEFYKARIVNYFHSVSLKIDAAKDVVVLINFFDFSFPKLMKAISVVFTICHIGKLVLHL